jgi:DNA-binding MarR family transcriptional regulator
MARSADDDYRKLASFRYEIRKFLSFSEQAARGVGVEPQQHQLLLTIKGLPEDLQPTVGVLAERLCVQPHTAVALVDKLEQRELVVRERSEVDRRQVLVRVTTAGDRLLRQLSTLHKAQLLKVAPRMVEALTAILREEPQD